MLYFLLRQKFCFASRIVCWHKVLQFIFQEQTGTDRRQKAKYIHKLSGGEEMFVPLLSAADRLLNESSEIKFLEVEDKVTKFKNRLQSQISVVAGATGTDNLGKWLYFSVWRILRLRLEKPQQSLVLFCMERWNRTSPKASV